MDICVLLIFSLRTGRVAFNETCYCCCCFVCLFLILCMFFFFFVFFGGVVFFFFFFYYYYYFGFGFGFVSFFAIKRFISALFQNSC